MYRLFGLVANKEVDIEFSMLKASNRFKKQSIKNPHGWGIGYYKGFKPIVEKYVENAFYSSKFDELVKNTKAKIFIAHVRLATTGSVNSNENAHPFVYKNWIFAHNGTIDKERIMSLLKSPFNQNFTSKQIDSEIYFRYLIQSIEKTSDIIKGITLAVKNIIKEKCIAANFLLSDGKSLYAFKYHRDLNYLVRDPKSFNFFSKETDARIRSKMLIDKKAILVSTEKLTENRKWIEIKGNTLLIIDASLNLKKIRITV